MQESLFYKKTKSKDLKVGDVIKVKNERIPADLVILHSINPSVYIKTD